MSEPSRRSLADEVQRAFAEEAVELLRRVDVALNELPLAAAEARTALVLEMMRALHTLKGAASAAGQDAIKADAHLLEDRAREIEARRGPPDRAVMDEIHVALDRVHRALGPLPAAGPDAAPEPVSSVRSALDLLRVKPEKIDALHALVGELAVARREQEAISARLPALREQAIEAAASLRQLGARIERLRRQLPEPISLELAALARASSAAIGGAAAELASLARDAPTLDAQAAAASASLEDGLRALRLTPIEPFFQEFAKVVREAAREGRKEARLTIAGEGAAIDRLVLMKLHEPLLHLVRNAVVHGIEAPDRRRAAGKGPIGTIGLAARCEGTRAILRVLDDGAGIDVDRVREKAILAGLVAEAAPFGDEDLLEVLTHPGFSTREIADGLAGRGIGLDVVASAIADLDGKLRLDNLPGAGCAFTIEVPVSASQSGGLVARVGDHLVGILFPHIECVIRLGAEDVRVAQGREVALVAGAPVAVIPLADLLGVAGAPAAAKKPAVVLRHGKQRLVVVVDDIPGEQTLAVRPFGRALRGAPLFIGGAVQADRSIVPVLDVAAIFARAARGAPHRLGIEPLARADRVSILVVDDSVTMRTLLRNILRAAGYTVAVAHDGRSALLALEGLERCHLLVTDLQMPGMDGVALCRAVRSSARPNLPIVMVTSVGDPEERRLALEAGADAYIVKSDFDQAELVDLVQRLTGAPIAA